MTPDFLKILIQKYPNSYELGEMIKRFHFLYIENENTKMLIEIERMFIDKYVNK
jgi:hypothetical protein